MNKEVINDDIDEALNNISLFTKRLHAMIDYVRMKNVNFIDKIIICDFIEEITYNLNAEIKNAVYLMKNS